MAHLKALGIKELYTISILLFFTLFESISFGHIFLISILLTGLTYLLVDIYFLRIFGQMIAAAFDFGFSFLIIWFASAAIIGQSSVVVIMSLFVACLFTLSEGIFHGYMKENVLRKRLAIIIPFPNMDLQTEASKEVYPEKDNKE